MQKMSFMISKKSQMLLKSILLLKGVILQCKWSYYDIQIRDKIVILFNSK